MQTTAPTTPYGKGRHKAQHASQAPTQPQTTSPIPATTTTETISAVAITERLVTPGITLELFQQALNNPQSLVIKNDRYEMPGLVGERFVDFIKIMVTDNNYIDMQKVWSFPWCLSYMGSWLDSIGHLIDNLQTYHSVFNDSYVLSKSPNQTYTGQEAYKTILLNTGDINASVTPDGNSVLQEAIKCNAIELVEQLLALGTNPNHKNNQKISTIWFAARLMTKSTDHTIRCLHAVMHTQLYRQEEHTTTQ